MKSAEVLSAAAIVTAVTLVSAAPGLAQSRHHTKTHSTHAASTQNDPEFSPLEELASDIDQLGTSDYPSSYIGVDVSDSTVDVYVVPGNDGALLNAIAGLDTSGLSYTVEYGSRDYSSLAGTSQWIADNQDLLSGEGITLAWWGSYPSADATRIAIEAPTDTQLSELQSAADQALPSQPDVTQQSYTTVAAAVMNTQIPSGGYVVPYPQLEGQAQPSGHTDDSSPFYGADQIEYTLSNTEECTSNFTYKTDSGGDRIFTAAHCSGYDTGHDFYTCHTTSGRLCDYNMGTVSQTYTNDQDFELMSSSGAGVVWDDSTSDKTYSVNGYITAEQGDNLTTDGEHGSHYDEEVLQGGTDTCVNYGHITCHAFVIYGGTTDICPAGDSGGPVFQRESDGEHIEATGLILAREEVNGNWRCYAQQVYWIRQAADVTVVWGP